MSVFYLIKQKSFIPKKKYDLGRSQYQNKKALFTDPIFSDGFAHTYHQRLARSLYFSCHSTLNL